MKDLILKTLRENGTMRTNEIIEAINAETKYREFCEEIAYLQMEGFVTYLSGKGYSAK